MQKKKNQYIKIVLFSLMQAFSWSLSYDISNLAYPAFRGVYQALLRIFMKRDYRWLEIIRGNCK